jgi:hypothetical protein
VPLADMERTAAKAVHQLLATALSRSTHTRVSAITGLEDVLDESENGRHGRHAGDYWTALFGEPGDEPWGWRFEGHHVSLNVTLADGDVSATPCFLGANPAVVTDDAGRTVSRPLAPEEDLAAALLVSLDDGQRDRALTGGLPAAALRPDQLTLLRALAALYLGRLEPGLAEPHLTRLDKDLSSFSFTWAGATEPVAGQPHSYRLEGPRVLVELDNRQHGANHVHSVWRDPGGDFGARLLR